MCNQCNFNHTHIFTNAYELEGRDWVHLLSDEDRKLFAEIGRRHSDFSKMGQQRAKQALRDKKGRYITNPNNIAITVARMNMKSASPANRAWAVMRLKEEIEKSKRSQNEYE